MSEVGDTAVTDRVVAIVREVLDLNELRPATPVGPDDDLYDLGFDSLLIIQVAARVRERLGVDPPLAAYFDAGTVSELVETVAGAVPAGPSPAVEATP